MLDVNNVTVYYGKALALKDVNVRVDKGAVVGIIGPNGAGKTTLLNAISGIVKCTAGHIKLNSERIDNLPPHEIVRRGVVHCPEGRHVAPEMTVMENLELGAYLCKDKKKMLENLEMVFQLFPILKERTSQLAQTLSGGEQQMLAIGRSLMSSPKLLMLDEPSLGLAPKLKEKIFENISQIHETGISILIVEQDVSMILKLADRFYLIESGEVALEGTERELLHSEHVRISYLGI